MWKAFQRYRALPPESRALFHRAVFLLPWVALSLRLRGFKKTQAALQNRLTSTSSWDSRKPTNAETVEHTCRMVAAGARYGVVHPSCLPDSLTLWYLLQKQNIPATLRIGVSKSSKKFEAHAWVEHEGSALNQTEDHHQHYVAFDNAFSDLSDEKL